MSVHTTESYGGSGLLCLFHVPAEHNEQTPIHQ